MRPFRATPRISSTTCQYASPPGAGAITAGMIDGSRPSQSTVTRHGAPSGTRLTARATPVRWTSSAVTISTPQARASATSATRALPTPRSPTWIMRRIHGISDARRIGLLYP